MSAAVLYGDKETPRFTIRERPLLILLGAFMAVNALALSLQTQPFDVRPWLFFAVWVGCAVAGTILLERRLPNRDRLLLPLVLGMAGWGLLLIERLAPPFAERQALWLILSTAAMLGVATLPPALRWLRTYRYLLLIGGLFLLVATILLGVNPSGSTTAPQLWLGFGGIFFQPSEALKVILVAFLASYLAEQYPALRAETFTTPRQRLRFSPRIIGPILLMWGLSVVVLVWQRDLGTAILFFVVFLVLLYAASGYRRILMAGGLLIAVAAVVAYRAFDVVQLRVDIWLNPWPEADGRAYQIVQSLLAFASGSTFGQGVGQGSPTYIPVVHSDFVFAALAEEWGLLGVIVAITLLATLITRGLRIAISVRERPFYALLAIGLSVLIGAQSLLIMAGVLKLIPLTGVTLPFFSYGGSSLLISFIIVGLLMRLSAEAR